MQFDKLKTMRYLICTFVVSWVIQCIAAWCTHHGNPAAMQVLLIVVMYTPFLGALLSKAPVKELGWKPDCRGKGRYILMAWFLPGILTFAGAALYFLVFPKHFDMSGAYLQGIAGENALAQLEAQGLTYPMYLAIAIISCFTYAPLLNMLAALGEEVGWRGVLYPQLKARFGRNKGWIIGGAIWGIWHWPLILLMGYEYGTAYWGYPLLGMLMFCVFTAAMGVFCDFVYEKTGCIWFPSIVHGAINAAATVSMAFWNPDYEGYRLLGPSCNGLIAGIPVILCALWIARKKRGKDDGVRRNI